ncbi:MAG: hypothetical protein KGI38_12705, partial [Thaumarchaeota archaeon]|nr:hypothetical protein [Nitrososphaerota archaeon]
MTHISLVVHAEGLINPKTVDALETLGRSLGGKYKPVLATITPLNAMYHTDPLVDPLRLKVKGQTELDGHLKRFEETLAKLSRWFDIAYHGHFFLPTFEGFVPCVDSLGATPQFLAE